MSVALVGLYPITPKGEGPDELYRALCGPERPASDPDAGIDLDLTSYTDSKHAYLDPTTRLALACACGAADDAGWSGDGKEAGLVVGTALGCLTSLGTHLETVSSKGGRLASPFVFSHAYPNTPNSVISIDLGLTGYNSCLVCGQVSGGVAVGCASDQIVLGRHRRILAGGVDSPPRWTAPGACFLALENEELARSEGREIKALILGWACRPTTAADALAGALADAGLSSEDLDGTVGNAGAGKPHLNLDARHGSGIGASAVLDAVSICLLGARGWGPFPALGYTLAVSRRDPSGLCYALLLQLPGER